VIVVDTNIIAYLLLGGEKTPQARAVLQKDPEWTAPILWRSEFRNVLAYYIRQGTLVLTDALQLMLEAELLFQGEEYHVESSQVLSLVLSSRCSAYDCEFIALARYLNVSLVTSDAQVLAEFPDTAVSLDAFISM
jgi:predicted nucleic acid-binding protein